MGLKIVASPGIRINDERVCVLYGADGQIFHVHHHFSMQEKKVAESEIEKAARRAARSAPFRHTRKTPRELLALHLPAKDFDPSQVFRVDPRRKVLVAIPEEKIDGRP
jgi:hypothetical protein